MLLDPRWDKQPSMAGFALFVASQDPNKHYNWRHCCTCAVGLYLQSIDRYCDVREWTGVVEEMNVLAKGYSYYNDESEWTFGKLADRILAYQIIME